MSKIEQAKSVFSQGFNCAQAVLSAFAPEFGLDPVMAYRVAAAFGGGMGHMGDTCGAVTGAFMVIGLKYGMTVVDGSQSHRDAFRNTREFSRQFKELHGSIICREILGFDIGDREAFREAQKKGIPQKICPRLVQDAARIVEGLISTGPKEEKSESANRLCQSES